MGRSAGYLVCPNCKASELPPMYPAGYFPRKYRYKKDAVAVAMRLVESGVSHVRIECPNGGELDYRPTK